jgi:hypothetical protein
MCEEPWQLAHGDSFLRRAEWFEPPPEASLVLSAFTFKQPFPP